MKHSGLSVMFGADIKKEFSSYFGDSSGGGDDGDSVLLRKKIVELQNEIKELKGDTSSMGNTFGASFGGFGGGARPMTASTQQAKISTLEDKYEEEKL